MSFILAKSEVHIEDFWKRKKDAN